MRISDWSSDVCSTRLNRGRRLVAVGRRLGVQVELPLARYLLDGCRRHDPGHRQKIGWSRQAQRQEDCSGLSRLALRQGTYRPAAIPFQGQWLRLAAISRYRAWRSAKIHVAAKDRKSTSLNSS